MNGDGRPVPIPIRIRPDLDLIFFHRSLWSARDSVRRLVLEHGCHVLVTGKPGVGKTALLNLIEGDFAQALPAGHCSRLSLLAWRSAACFQDDQDRRAHGVTATAGDIGTTLRATTRVALVDDAGDLDITAVEKLIVTATQTRVTLVLVGPPSIASIVESLVPETPGTAIQNIHLDTPQDDEIPGYIRHRLAVLGYPEGPSPASEALRLVAHHSGRRPSFINMILGQAMVVAHQSGADRLLLQHVEEVVRDNAYLLPPPLMEETVAPALDDQSQVPSVSPVSRSPAETHRAIVTAVSSASHPLLTLPIPWPQPALPQPSRDRPDGILGHGRLPPESRRRRRAAIASMSLALFGTAATGVLYLATATHLPVDTGRGATEIAIIPAEAAASPPANASSVPAIANEPLPELDLASADAASDTDVRVDTVPSTGIPAVDDLEAAPDAPDAHEAPPHADPIEPASFPVSLVPLTGTDMDASPSAPPADDTTILEVGTPAPQDLASDGVGASPSNEPTADPSVASDPAKVSAVGISTAVVPPEDEPSPPTKVQPVDQADLRRELAGALRQIERGNIAAARAILDHVDDTGTGEALFMLAETYDPARLRAWGVIGIKPDPERAAELYGRAAARGHPAAAERLAARSDGIAGSQSRGQQ